MIFLQIALSWVRQWWNQIWAVLASTLAQNDMCPQFCVLQFVSLQVGVQNSAKKRPDSIKNFESNAHWSTFLNTTNRKKSPVVLFSLTGANRYPRNLAGVGIIAGRVNIFPDHRNRAREREGREREFHRQIERAKIESLIKLFLAVLSG